MDTLSKDVAKSKQCIYNSQGNAMTFEWEIHFDNLWIGIVREKNPRGGALAATQTH